MSKAFNLTAQLNLAGPNNLKPIVSKIKKEIGAIKADVRFSLDPKAAKSIDDVKNRLNAMNTVLAQAKGNANDLNATLRGLSASLSSVKASGAGTSTAIMGVAKTAATTAKNIKVASSQMEEFGKQSYLAIKRFAAFGVAAGGIYRLINAVTTGFKAFIEFDKQLVRLQQVTGDGSVALQNLSKQITSLSVTLGVSSEKLTEVAVTLAQAGLSAKETEQALNALAKTELAPSFDDITETTEGAIAAMRQFGISTKDLEGALGSINSVAAAFAVESSDIITAIQRAGGAFAASSTGVSEGTDALNEFISVFTSVRATTRESAETIATGLRTIFTRVQRPQTIEFLRQFGVDLTDLEGKFVGPYEAIKRLSSVLNKLDPRDLRFAQIVEELGGFRQISKVIPLIQQFSEAEKALKVAQQGQSSLTKAQEIAQQSLAVQLAKVREEFLALIKTVGQSDTFQGFFKLVLGLSSALIKLAGAFRPILPALAILGTIKGGKAIAEFGGGFLGSFKKGGGSKAAGTALGSSLTGSVEKDRTDATNTASEALRNNTSALTLLTASVETLTKAINARNKGGSTFNSGGVVGFATGGVVPGSGNRDTVPAMLTPGEFVIRKKAVETIGAGNLQRMNKYADGGIVETSSFSIDELLRVSGSKSLAQAIANTNIEAGPNGDTAKIKINSRNIELTEKDFENIWNKANAAAGSSKSAMFKSYAGVNVGNKNRDLLRKLNEEQVSYKDLPEDDKNSLAMFRSAEGRWGKAYEEILTEKLNGNWTSASNQSDYPIDIVRKAKNDSIKSIGEAKFRTKPTDPIDLVSKLLRYRIDRNSTSRYFKENDPSDRDLDVLLGKLDYFWAGDQKLDFYNWIQKQQDLKKDNFNFGGLVQKFLRGGTVEETAQLENITLQDSVIAWLKELGGIQGIKDISGIAGNDRTLDSALRLNNIKSGGNKFQIAVEAINKALSNKTARKVREAQSINKMLKLGIVGLEPLGYNKDEPFDTKFGKAALLIRGLPDSPEYASLIEELQGGVSGLGRRFALGLQNASLTKGQQLVLDFDETLVDGADILNEYGSPDIPSYSDLDKVKKQLQNGRLTPLAEKLKSISDYDPSFLENVRILTARPQSNAPLLAERLNQLGLPIPASKITGISGGNKGTAMGIAEKLIDDNVKNVMAAISQGKSAKQYAALRDVTDQEARAKGRASAEGAILELALSELGAYGGTIKENSVDFEQGLGLQAAGIFGIPPDILTEVKRTLSGAAIGRAKDQFTRYLDKIDTAPGIGQDVYSISKTTGLPVSRFASGGEVYSPAELAALAKYRVGTMIGGKTDSQFINRYLEDKQSFMDWLETFHTDPKAAYDSTAEAAKNLLGMFQKSESLTGSSRSGKLYSTLAGGKLKTVLSQIGNPLASDKDISNAIDKTFNLNGSLLSTSESLETAQMFQPENGSSATMSILRKRGSPSIDVDKTVFDTATEDNVIKALSQYYDPASGKSGDELLNKARSKIRIEKEFILPPDAKFRILDIDKIYTKDQEDKLLGGNIRHIEGMKVQQFAKGGSAQDTVPALLTPGEFVINKNAAKRIGYAKLNKLNNADKVQGFNKGGGVGYIQKFAIGGGVGAGPDPRVIAAIEDAAKRAGMAMSEFEKQLKRQIINASLNISEQRKSTRADLRTDIIKTAAKGLGNKESQKDFFNKLQQKIKTLNPSAKDSDINKAVKEIFQGIKSGKTFDEMLKTATTSLKPLNDALDAASDNTIALKEAQDQLASEFGGLTDAIKVSITQLNGAEYKRSGQAAKDFGLAGDLAPEIALAFKQSKIGENLLGVAKGFQNLGISGLDETLGKLPGPIGDAVKAVGGIPGVIAGFSSVLGDVLKNNQIFGTSVAGAGVVGALSGAGANAISLGTLGQQLAGPIGGVIGTIGGAIGGAIDGFLQGSKIQLLENSMATLNENVDAANKALDNLAQLDNARNYESALKSVDNLRDNINDLGYQAQSTLGEKSLSGLSGAATGTVAGGIAGMGIYALLPTISSGIFNLGASLAATSGILSTAGTAIAGFGLAITSLPLIGIVAVTAGIAALGYGIYQFVRGTPEIDKQALEGQLKAIENYTKGLSQVTQRTIRLSSLSDIESGIAAYQNATTPQQKAALGRNSAILQEAEKGAKARGVSAETAKTEAAIALAMQELNQIYGGNTDAIKKESQDKEKLLQRGLELAAEQSYQIQLQERMAIVMKEVNKETESLIELFNKMDNVTTKFNSELESSQTILNELTDTMVGKGKMGKTSRQDQEILKNSGAYSQEQFDAVLERIGKLAGGGENAQKLKESLSSKRIIEQKLPGLLRDTKSQNIPEVTRELEKMFKNAGISSETTNALISQVTENLQKETQGRQGKSFKELASEFPALEAAMSTYTAVYETGTNILEANAKALDAFKDNLDKSRDSLTQTFELMKKADEIRLETAMKLDEMLGTTSVTTSADVKDAEIRRLTKNAGIGETLDPSVIGQALENNSKQLEEVKKQLQNAPDNQDLIKKEDSLIASNNNLYNALVELQNSTEKTSVIMDKFSKSQELAGNTKDILRDIYTNSSEDNMKLAQQMVLGSQFIQNPTSIQGLDIENRKNAFAGLDFWKKLGLVTPQEESKVFLESIPEELRKMVIARMEGQGKTFEDLFKTDTEKLTEALREEATKREAANRKLQEANQRQNDAYITANQALIEAINKNTETLNNVKQSTPTSGTINIEQEQQRLLEEYINTFKEKSKPKPSATEGGAARHRFSPDLGLVPPQRGSDGRFYNPGTAPIAANIPQTDIPKPTTTPTGTPAAPTTTAAVDRTTPPGTASASMNLLTIDNNTKTFLTEFQGTMNKFDSYVTRMKEIADKLPVIPSRIEMQGRHTVQVNITGDKVWASLESRMTEFIQGEVDKKMNAIWNKSGGEFGSSGAGGSRVASRFDTQSM